MISYIRNPETRLESGYGMITIHRGEFATCKGRMLKVIEPYVNVTRLWKVHFRTVVDTWLSYVEAFGWKGCEKFNEHFLPQIFYLGGIPIDEIRCLENMKNDLKEMVGEYKKTHKTYQMEKGDKSNMPQNSFANFNDLFEGTKKSFRAVYKDDIRMYESFCLNEKNTQSIIKV